jgi:hypothetical protein
MYVIEHAWPCRSEYCFMVGGGELTWFDVDLKGVDV